MSHANVGDEPPAELRVIALLFRVEAVLALVGILWALSERRLNLNVGVLGFWIAPGLLRGERVWRAWALAFSVAQTLGLGFLSVLAVLSRTPVTVSVYGSPVYELPFWTILLLLVPLAMLGSWQWWVLMRPEIRRRFVPDDYEDGPEPLLRIRPR